MSKYKSAPGNGASYIAYEALATLARIVDSYDESTGARVSPAQIKEARVLLEAHGDKFDRKL